MPLSFFSGFCQEVATKLRSSVACMPKMCSQPGHGAHTLLLGDAGGWMWVHCALLSSLPCQTYVH